MGLFEPAAYLGALLGLAAYVLNYARSRTAWRLLSSSGLFFTAAALAILPYVLDTRGPVDDLPQGWTLLAFLLLALLAQAVAAFRVRPSRDGRLDRATDTAPEAFG